MIIFSAYLLIALSGFTAFAAGVAFYRTHNLYAFTAMFMALLFCISYIVIQSGSLSADQARGIVRWLFAVKWMFGAGAGAHYLLSLREPKQNEVK